MPDTATVSPTPEAQVATPVTEPAGANGTASNNGSEAAGAAPSGETFFNGDPNSLPPELKPAYDNMLKDYKTKTSEVAQVRKKAEQFDQISRDQRFVDYWNGLNRQQKSDFKEQKQEVEKKLGEKITDDRFKQAFETKDGFLELMAEVARESSAKDRKEIESLKQYKTVGEAERIVEAFATEAGQDGKPIRPDFYTLDEDGLINGFLRLSAPDKGYTAEEYPQKLNEAYSWAKQTTQKYYEKGRQDALARIQQKAATSTNPPTQPVKGAYTGPEPKKLSVREAMDLAKRGIRVPSVE